MIKTNCRKYNIVRIIIVPQKPHQQEFLDNSNFKFFPTHGNIRSHVVNLYTVKFMRRSVI